MTPFNFYQVIGICIIFLFLVHCTSNKNVNHPDDNVNIAFNNWLTEYKKQATRNIGVTQETLDLIFKDVKYNENIIRLDNKQVEFTVTAEKYFSLVLPEEVYTQGYAFLKKHWHEILPIVEKYQVPPHVIIAFMGIETRYGTKKPSYRAAEALSNLAFYPRRSAFFTKELNALIILINKGYVPVDVKSSWAGALGFPQFMPSNYLYYGLDGNDDDKVDLITNYKDTFASVANFLRALGWNYYRDWGYEVILPDNFNQEYITNKTKLPIYQWQNMNVRKINNEPFSNISSLARIILVDGKTYLVTSNFDVILKWNKSVLFALAVGTLSDKLKEYSSNLDQSVVAATPKKTTTKGLQNSQALAKKNTPNTTMHLNQQHINVRTATEPSQDWLFEEKRRIADGEIIR